MTSTENHDAELSGAPSHMAAQLDALFKSEGVMLSPTPSLGRATISYVGMRHALHRLGFDVRIRPLHAAAASAAAGVGVGVGAGVGVGVGVGVAEDLMSLSHNQLSTPPPPFWRPLCNTVFRIAHRADGSVLPAVGRRCPDVVTGMALVALGVPEVFAVPSERLQELLDDHAAAHRPHDPSRYDISPIIYGTVLWAYALVEVVGSEPMWRVGSKRSPDCTATPIRGVDLTALLWKSIDRSMLDPRYTYSFLIHHRPLHGLEYEFETRAWLLSALDPITGAEAVSRADGASAGLGRLPSTRGSVGELMSRFTSSSDSLDGDSCDMGMILRERSDDAATPSRRDDIIIKSPLHAFIDRKMGDPVSIVALVARTLFDETIVRQAFLRTFPGFMPTLEQCQRRFDELCRMLVLITRCGMRESVDAGRSATDRGRESWTDLDVLGHAVIDYARAHGIALGRGDLIDTVTVHQILSEGASGSAEWTCATGRRGGDRRSRGVDERVSIKKVLIDVIARLVETAAS